MVFQPQAQLQHVLFIASRVGGEEEGSQVLLLAGFFRIEVKRALEFIIGGSARLHHLRKSLVLDVLWCGLEIATYMMGHEFLVIFRTSQCQVISQT